MFKQSRQTSRGADRWSKQTRQDTRRLSAAGFKRLITDESRRYGGSGRTTTRSAGGTVLHVLLFKTHGYAYLAISLQYYDFVLRLSG